MLRVWVHLLLLGVISSSVAADSIYPKNSPVLQVTAKTFDSLISQSNHTSIVEFYAPWCGHCQNLKPAYEKAAKNLAGLAKVAAVNCDDDENKPLCGQMQVQGFPTLKIVKPGAKKGKPAIEDYQGQRSAKAIVDAVVDKIPNHVKKLEDKSIEAWLTDSATAYKLVLFTDKGTTSALLRALAIDYLGVLNVGQIRSKETDAVGKYDVTEFPTLMLFSGSGEPKVYTGELKKDAIVAFLKQVADPNPDPAPRKSKTASKKSKTDKSSATVSSEFSRASESHKSSDFENHMQKSGTVVVENDMPTESPLPIVEQEPKPIVVQEAAAPIEKIADFAKLAASCLAPKSGTCILVFLPAEETESDSVTQALTSFAEIAQNHKKRQANVFPFYAVTSDNEAGQSVRKALALQKHTTLDIIAINMKRKWWKGYQLSTYDEPSIESFIDAIKLGEGAKEKLPADFAARIEGGTGEASVPTTDSMMSSATVAANDQETASADPPVHNEL